jgi:hypothetical protein
MIEESKGALSFLDEQALEQGLAKKGIHSLILCREYSKDKITEAKSRDDMTVSEWYDHCEVIRKQTAEKIDSILKQLRKEFGIYQLDGREAIAYSSDWDLFFWCNCTKEGRDLSYVTLSANSRRSLEKQLETFDNVIETIKKIGFNGLDIRIQLQAVYDDEKLKKLAEEKYEKIKNSIVSYNGLQGKIKEVGQGGILYGFYPKWSRNKFYEVSNLEMALENK